MMIKSSINFELKYSLVCNVYSFLWDHIHIQDSIFLVTPSGVRKHSIMMVVQRVQSNGFSLMMSPFTGDSVEDARKDTLSHP